LKTEAQIREVLARVKPIVDYQHEQKIHYSFCDRDGDDIETDSRDEGRLDLMEWILDDSDDPYDMSELEELRLYYEGQHEEEEK
jgi:hypothetical protein